MNRPEYPIVIQGGRRQERYRKVDYYCPNCGTQGQIYEEQYEDYECGHTYVCTACSYQCYGLDGIHEASAPVVTLLIAWEQVDRL